MKNQFILVLAVLALAGAARAADAGTITIQADKPGAETSPLLYGIFFEEISHAGDGGLYAELLQNRSFEETVPVEGTTLVEGRCVGPNTPHYLGPGAKKRRPNGQPWSQPWQFESPWPAWSLEAAAGAATMTLETMHPLFPGNVQYLRLNISQPGARLLNEGYWGVAVKQGETYDCSFYARHAHGGDGGVRVGVLGTDGRELGAAMVAAVDSKDWKKFTASFPSLGTDAKAKFFLEPLAAGGLDLDMISLFPRHTFKDRPNGLRADIAQKLADLKPAFMRFPGGCVVEGATFANRYRWKETLGDVAARPGHWSLWGYRNTDGLGYHEFLQLCEDLGCAGMYVCSVGLACEFRNGDFVSGAQLDAEIQNALDAAEYALGAPDSKWGALRAQAGHPAPFPLQFVELGNENHGPLYNQYYNRFAAAFRKAWPQLKLIFNGGTGDSSPGKEVQNVDLFDEHYYKDADFFFANQHRYDDVSRQRGYDVYVGEFACNKGVGRGNLRAALAEAAFMLGMERNSDLIKLCSYAPLFFNVSKLNWPVNMIGYDSAVSFGRSTYYAQKLLAEQRPDVNLTCAIAPPAGMDPKYFAALAGLDRKAKEIVLRLVNGVEQPVQVEVRIAGVKVDPQGDGRIITMSGKLAEENDENNPTRIQPLCSPWQAPGQEFTLNLKPASLTVVRIPIK
jgi:alpha-N-arabinofuranosidase